MAKYYYDLHVEFFDRSSRIHRELTFEQAMRWIEFYMRQKKDYIHEKGMVSLITSKYPPHIARSVTME